MREDWVEVELKDICEISMGQSPPSSTYNTQKNGLPFFQGKAEFGEVFPTAVKWCSEPKRTAEEGDILLSVRAPVGATNFAKERCAIGRGLAAITYHQSPVFLFYYLRSIQHILDKKGTGTTFKAISGKVLKTQKFPLPPLPEQRAIVAKLEQLFSELDSGVAELQRAQDKLKIYRQAVLKKAFEGELTKEWRNECTLSVAEGRAEPLPSAEELLEQIKTAREEHYARQLEEWKAAVKEWENNGKEGKKPNKPRIPKQLAAIDVDVFDSLPALPKEWTWAKMGLACQKIMDGTHFSPKNFPEGEYKYISAKHVKEGYLDLSTVTYVSEKDHLEIFGRCDVRKGDVLYIKDGATTGRACVNPLEEDFSLLSSVGVFRTNSDSLIPKYLEHYLNAQVTRNRMLKNIAGVAITRLTLVKLNNALLVLPSIEEQHQVVQEIESRLSVCDKLEESISTNLQKAEALRQSILKKAFEGRLLSEAEVAACKLEEDWCPAGELLERSKEKLEATKQAN